MKREMKETVMRMKRVIRYFRREVVLSVALAAALLSFLLVAPGPHTLAGIDFTTLMMLFSLMTVVAGFRGMGAFQKVSALLSSRLHTQRGFALALTGVCFVLSMVATNDVALITLVPLTLLLLGGAESGVLIRVIVMETIAANLGSMVTPIGNPQNMYLYASGRLTAGEFPALLGPYALLALGMLLMMGLSVPKWRVEAEWASGKPLSRRLLTVYGCLTLVALLTIAKLLPVWVMASVTLVTALIFDRDVLRWVDYTLLATFVCFFVFVASVKECAPIRAWLEEMMAASPMLVSLLTSQVISNVPACLLLAPFTQQAGALAQGVDLGGLGTLVASLASLISFRLYGAAPRARKGRFFLVFTFWNAVFLAAMLLLSKARGAW